MELTIAKAFIKGSFQIPIDNVTDVKGMEEKLKEVSIRAFEDKLVYSHITYSTETYLLFHFQIDELGKLDDLHDRVEKIIEEYKARNSILKFEYVEKVIPEDWMFEDSNGNLLNVGDIVKCTDPNNTFTWVIYELGWSVQDDPIVSVHQLEDENNQTFFLLNEVNKVENQETIKGEVGNEVIG